MDHSFDQEVVPDRGHIESRLVQGPPAAVDDGSIAPAISTAAASSNSSRPAEEPARAIWILAICGFLLLAVGLVFGQTVGYEFVAHDDDDSYVYDNPHIAPGLTLSGLRYAVTDCVCG